MSIRDMAILILMASCRMGASLSANSIVRSETAGQDRTGSQFTISGQGHVFNHGDGTGKQDASPDLMAGQSAPTAEKAAPTAEKAAPAAEESPPTAEKSAPAAEKSDTATDEDDENDEDEPLGPLQLSQSCEAYEGCPLGMQKKQLPHASEIACDGDPPDCSTTQFKTCCENIRHEFSKTCNDYKCGTGWARTKHREHILCLGSPQSCDEPVTPRTFCCHRIDNGNSYH